MVDRPNGGDSSQGGLRRKSLRGGQAYHNGFFPFYYPFRFYLLYYLKSFILDYDHVILLYYVICPCLDFP